MGLPVIYIYILGCVRSAIQFFLFECARIRVWLARLHIERIELIM